MVTANVPELDTVTFRGACGVVLSISNADLSSKIKIIQNIHKQHNRNKMKIWTKYFLSI